jgi:hypothetical protein
MSKEVLEASEVLRKAGESLLNALDGFIERHQNNLELVQTKLNQITYELERE